MHIFIEHGGNAVSEYDIKDNFDDYNVKKKKKRKKIYCPYCDHAMKIKILNGFKYCNVCHKQLPGFAFVNNYNETKSVKEMKL